MLQDDLLIALNAAPKLSRGAICRLAESFDDLWPPRRPAVDVSRDLSLPVQSVEKARDWLARADEVASRERSRAAAHGATIVTRFDAAYPGRLEDLALPPAVLYVRGTIPERVGVALVGSRRADRYGLEVAHLFGRELAAAGIPVISGFARGVDAAAHDGAAEIGQTVAVLGCGLDLDYPAGQTALARRIIDRGAIVSELPLGTPPRAWNFPVRNRIIAALAERIVVVQATARSGSLITARYALELGREVWAVPGRIFDERAMGPNGLLRDGAYPALCPRDLIEAHTGRAPFAVPTQRELPLLPGLPGEVFRVVGEAGEATLDQLVEATGSPVDRLFAALLELELGGRLAKVPGPAWTTCR